jgi:general secretion pathway protein B
MSYILDALRRSERERSAAQSPVLPPDSPLPVRRAPRAAVLAVAGAFALATAGWLYLGRNSASPPPATVADPAPAAVPETEVAKSDVIADATPPRADVVPPRQPGTNVVRALSEEARLPSPPKPAAAAAPLIKATAINAGEIPFLRALPDDLRRGLPEMVVNIHVYTADESQRLLYINNRQYRRGDTLEGGVVVEEIVPDGVVLQYHGLRFKLPRPS